MRRVLGGPHKIDHPIGFTLAGLIIILSRDVRKQALGHEGRAIANYKWCHKVLMEHNDPMDMPQWVYKVAHKQKCQYVGGYRLSTNKRAYAIGKNQGHNI